MSERVRCCCPCMCEFQADMPPPLPVGPQFMHAPRCPECAELMDRNVPDHSGQAIIHGGIKFLSSGYGARDGTSMRR